MSSQVRRLLLKPSQKCGVDDARVYSDTASRMSQASPSKRRRLGSYILASHRAIGVLFSCSSLCILTLRKTLVKSFSGVFQVPCVG